MKQTQQWFIDRIGKAVFIYCTVSSMGKLAPEFKGTIKIRSKEQAYVLWACQNQDYSFGEPPGIDMGATFDRENKYRYELHRIWNNKKPIYLFIGLNPSTATAHKNDRTIERVMAIVGQNGGGGFYMANLFTYISPYPSELTSFTSEEPAWFSYLQWLNFLSAHTDKTVFAWGDFKQARERSKEVINSIVEPYCLIQNAGGSPKHPLYCKKASRLIDFDKSLIREHTTKKEKV